MRGYSSTTEILLLLRAIQFVLYLEVDIFINDTALRSIDFSSESQWVYVDFLS